MPQRQVWITTFPARVAAAAIAGVSFKKRQRPFRHPVNAYGQPCQTARALEYGPMPSCKRIVLKHRIEAEDVPLAVLTHHNPAELSD